MKIAILCPTLFTFIGADRIVQLQAKEFAEGGNEVTIFTFKASIEPPQNVKLEVLGMPNNFLAQKIYLLLFPLDFAKAIKWVPKLRNFDEIYSHGHPLYWLAYLAKKLYGVKYIYYHHHSNPPEAFPSFIERIYTRLKLLLEKQIIKKADGAISVSQYSRQVLKQEVGLDSEVVYNKIDTQRFHPRINGSRIRQRHNLRSASVILFVGQILPHEGVHLLIKAFTLVRQQIPHARLVIVGKHPHRKYSEKLRQTSDNSAIFAGNVSDEDIPYYYGACDVYATASLWEGFNLPLAEAQACGKPVGSCF